MSRKAGRQADLPMKSATRPLSTNRNELPLSKVTLKQGVPESTKANRIWSNAKHARVNLPALARPKIVRIKEDYRFQTPSREVRYLDFSPQVITRERTISEGKQPGGISDSQSVTIWINGQEITRERTPFIHFNSHGRNTGDDKDKLKPFNVANILPLNASILEGKRVTLSAKGNANTEPTSKQCNCKQTAKTNTLTYQTGSTSREAVRKNTSSEISETQTSLYGVLLRPRKMVSRPVLHLPTADKYDITRPRNIIKGKVGSVLIERRKSGSRLDEEKFSPPSENVIIKNSVFKTILQRRAVLLRQPSPLAGVNFKVNLRQQEAESFFLRDTIQAVEETNALPAPVPVEVEVPRPVKKLVIRLPPIC